MSQYGNYNSIAIAISTYNRPEAFAQTLNQIKKHTPPEIPIYIVDGCSPEPYIKPDYQFTYRASIAEVKNKCLELCQDSDNIFLFDDDTHPIADDWYLPYINSAANHLAYCFGLEYGRNSNTKFHTVGKGCMLYFKKICIDTVGGFDTFYHNKFEHVDISYRIFNAGLTKAPFIDVINSDKILYCHDQDNSIQRTLTQQERDFNRHVEAKRHNKLNIIEKSSRYINFK